MFFLLYISLKISIKDKIHLFFVTIKLISQNKLDPCQIFKRNLKKELNASELFIF